MAKAVTERTTPQRRADGVKAAKTMRAKYGKNYFERIGKKGVAVRTLSRKALRRTVHSLASLVLVAVGIS